MQESSCIQEKQTTPATTDNQLLEVWEILVPTSTPDGAICHSREFHQIWDRQVNMIAGGLTILNPVKGNWISRDSTLKVENMIIVRIVCTKNQIHTIAEMTKNYYQQETVLAYKVSSDVIVVSS